MNNCPTCNGNNPNCPFILTGECVKYTGENLTLAYIRSGDDINTVIKKLYTFSVNCCQGGPTCIPVSITNITGNQSLNSGDDLSLSVTVTGTTPINYQWRKNNVIISGATNSSYNKSDVDSTDAGYYTVEVSNNCSDIYSDNITVAVTTPVVHFTGYWGWVDDINDITSVSDIQALQGSSNSFIHNGTFTADFRSNNTPKILVAFEPSTEPQKTIWYGSVLNTGNIGTSGDLFQVTTNISGWRGYYTDYATLQTQTTIQFKVN